MPGHGETRSSNAARRRAEEDEGNSTPPSKGEPELNAVVAVPA
jgi:hypothetical protein